MFEARYCATSTFDSFHAVYAANILAKSDGHERFSNQL
jgi:hypothetical protein